MADNEEYNSLVNEKADAQSQYNSCQSRISDYDYILGKLREAKTAIVEQKTLFEKANKADKKLKKEKTCWKGTTYTTFKGDVSSTMDANDYYYKNSVDYVLDELNDEITRIENKRLSEYGLLGKLGSWINSLTNEIENFFN